MPVCVVCSCTSSGCYKTFWRKSRKSRFPPVLKQQELSILKAKKVAMPVCVVYSCTSNGCFKLFWRKSRKSRFPPVLKQKEQSILKGIDSLRLQFYIKIAFFKDFSGCPISRTNFIQFLNFGEIQISSKKSFITSTPSHLVCSQFCLHISIRFQRRFYDFLALILTSKTVDLHFSQERDLPLTATKTNKLPWPPSCFFEIVSKNNIFYWHHFRPKMTSVQKINVKTEQVLKVRKPTATFTSIVRS